MVSPQIVFTYPLHHANVHVLPLFTIEQGPCSSCMFIIISIAQEILLYQHLLFSVFTFYFVIVMIVVCFIEQVCHCLRFFRIFVQISFCLKIVLTKEEK